jgi:hypothetical protein
VRRGHLKFVKNRLIGIVSRGGSLLAKWMLVHNQENIMYERWEDICDILRQYDVTFSIGDGLRPGGLADATDDAQLAELETLGELTERAWRRGVQVMIEGPGHVPFDQIEWNAKVQRTLCHGAPFYVLGPLVTDMFPGYDHITSCIGATSMAYHGAAMLCYVTPKEHPGLPKKDDVKQGCIAYKIAAHAADIALGIPGTRDRDDELTKARAALNWEKHFELSFDPDTARAYHDEDLDVDTDFCAMCGHDWCSVRISKEIQEFMSGKAEASREQSTLTEQRRVLSSATSAEELHRLASKTKGGRRRGRQGPLPLDLVEPRRTAHPGQARAAPHEGRRPPPPSDGAGSPVRAGGAKQIQRADVSATRAGETSRCPHAAAPRRCGPAFDRASSRSADMRVASRTGSRDRVGDLDGDRRADAHTAPTDLRCRPQHHTRPLASAQLVWRPTTICVAPATCSPGQACSCRRRRVAELPLAAATQQCTEPVVLSAHAWPARETAMRLAGDRRARGSHVPRSRRRRPEVP